jgi:hypothetical protein
VGRKTENRVSTKTRGGSAARKSEAAPTRTSRSGKATSTTTLPEDVRRNSYTADREAGLHVRGLRTS